MASPQRKAAEIRASAAAVALMEQVEAAAVGGRDRGSALCAAQALRSWAQADGLSGRMSRQGFDKRACLYIWYAPIGWRAPLRWRHARDLLGYSSGTMVSQVGNYVAIQGANIVAGRLLGAAALGIYSRANQFLMTPVNLFGTVVDQVLFPAMSKVQGDPDKLRRAYVFATSIIALITLPLSAVLVVLSPEIIEIIMGPLWDAVVLPFQILVSTLLFRTSYKMSDSLSRAVGAVYRRAWRQWLYAAIVITGTYVGHHWGVSGIALGVSRSISAMRRWRSWPARWRWGSRCRCAPPASRRWRSRQPAAAGSRC